MTRLAVYAAILLVFPFTFATPALAQRGGMPQQPPAPSPGYDLAKRAAEAAEAEARANSWNVTIVVTDAAGVPVYVKRLDGAAARTYDVALNKARTSAATGLTTLEYGQQVQAGTREAIENGITFEGGLPIRLNGELVGAIGTSGVRANQDAQISRAGLAAIGATE